jgi:GntR family transcriptional regulator
VRGMGLQVAEGAAQRCRLHRREIIRQRLRGAIDEARQSKMDPAEIAVILREEWARGHTSDNGAGQDFVLGTLADESRTGSRTEEGSAS